ncbi:hypothetical protein ACWC2T_20030 [Streptomyces sp. NPDC001393]
MLLARDADLSDAEVDRLLETPAGRQIEAMTVHIAVGTPPQVHDTLAQRTGADG